MLLEFSFQQSPHGLEFNLSSFSDNDGDGLVDEDCRKPSVSWLRNCNCETCINLEHDCVKQNFQKVILFQKNSRKIAYLPSHINLNLVPSGYLTQNDLVFVQVKIHFKYFY